MGLLLLLGNFFIIFILFNVIHFTALGIVIKILSLKKKKVKKDKHGHLITPHLK